MQRREDPISKQLHREIGKDLFNYTWTLIDRRDRTQDESDEMIHAAHASRYHWGRAGTPLNRAIAEWQISRVYAVLGRAEPATFHGERALEIALRYRLAPFYEAYGHEAIARAAGIKGNTSRRRSEARRAAQLLSKIRDADDRRMLREDLDTIH